MHPAVGPSGLNKLLTKYIFVYEDNIEEIVEIRNRQQIGTICPNMFEDALQAVSHNKDSSIDPNHVPEKRHEASKNKIIVDKETKKRIAVRMHIHGEVGEYLHPMDRHYNPSPAWFNDFGAEAIESNGEISCYVSFRASTCSGGSSYRK